MPTHPLWNPYMPLTVAEIDAARVDDAARQPRPIQVVQPNPEWPKQYDLIRARIATVLGQKALSIEHVGSTAVPGLWAKPIIDITLTVSDSSNEESWLPALESLGFILTVREPEWEEHRGLRAHDPQVNLHVFSEGAREPYRRLIPVTSTAPHPVRECAQIMPKLRSLVSTSALLGST